MYACLAHPMLAACSRGFCRQVDYDFEVAQAVMTRHYLVLVFLLSLGSLQFGASVGGLRGLWLLPDKRSNMVLAVTLGVAGIALFTFLPLWSDGPWADGSVVDGTSESRKWGDCRV